MCNSFFSRCWQFMHNNLISFTHNYIDRETICIPFKVDQSYFWLIYNHTSIFTWLSGLFSPVSISLDNWGSTVYINRPHQFCQTRGKLFLVMTETDASLSHLMVIDMDWITKESFVLRKKIIHLITIMKKFIPKLKWMLSYHH